MSDCPLLDEGPCESAYDKPADIVFFLVLETSNLLTRLKVILMINVCDY